MRGAQQKDLDTLLKAGDDLIESCQVCHKQYKLELPRRVFYTPINWCMSAAS